MGNNLSPTIAIIFMDFVEQQIITQAPVSVWLRYIDDIFFMSSTTSDELLRIANSINPAIQFTHEAPKDDQLPFLDTLVSLQPDGTFAYSLFAKPIHSGYTLPSCSHVPYSQKFGVMVHEFRRAIRCSSSDGLKEQSIQFIRQRFLNNGYRDPMIFKAIARAHRPPGRLLHNREQPIYVKVPFVDERSAVEMRKLARKTNLPIQLSFSNPKPLSLQLRKPQKPPCPNTCLCDNRGLCLKKNTVYCVHCGLCPPGTVDYIGETHRTLHKRTTEHCTKEDSNVYRHFVEVHQESIYETTYK